MSQALKRAEDDFNKKLENLRDIPTLPLVAQKVNQLISDPSSSASTIAEVLKKDQVLTAKILRLANSPYYAIPGGVTDVQRAIAFLGLNVVAQLILGLSVFTLFSEIDSDDFSMHEFWKHALATAVCSEILARRLKFPKPEDAFTCGLLHDIGKLVLHEIEPTRLAAIVKEAKKNKASFIETEIGMELPTHATLGHRVAEKWGLPLITRLVIKHHHHDASKLAMSECPPAKMATMIVRLANQIVVKCGIGKSGDCSEGRITPDMLFPLHLTENDLPAIEEQLKTDFEKTGAFLSAYR